VRHVQHPISSAISKTSKRRRTVQGTGALFVVSFDGISLGLLKRPGQYGATLAVGEGKSRHVDAVRRSVPRMMRAGINRPQDSGPNRRADGGWTGQTLRVLTLQTREQHIAREGDEHIANQKKGLFALRTAGIWRRSGRRG